MKQRPFGVTVLAILAGIAAVLAAIHALQSLQILPFFIGEFKVHAFSFWSAPDVGSDGLGVGMAGSDAVGGR